MLKHKHIDKICIAIFCMALLMALLISNGEELGIKRDTAAPPYSSRIFDSSYVHQVNLHVDDWEKFLTEASEEAYTSCDIVIDGEAFPNVGLRIKGNNSKNLVKKYGLSRYSMKIEFDHYTKGNTYYGLDKLNLDASFQDNSYLKNYITYDMMGHMGVPAPLCSYTWVTVNGADWGLFLTLEEPEEAFALRNFGKNHGQLYKPDYKNIDDENADIALKYIDDNPESYDNIFRKAKFDVSVSDQQRLINSLKTLASKENLETVVDVDAVLRYFVVQVFVVNLDSYLGPTGHNYFLYEEDGKISMLPWDYNLAYCTYSLGMPNPVNDAELYVNYPIDTPAWKEVMVNRPLFHNLMQKKEYYHIYHQNFQSFIKTYFHNGYFEKKVAETSAMIAPYVQKDPTAFCSYEDFLLAVKTFYQFCQLRAESVDRQLKGLVPSTIKGQSQDQRNFVDASSIRLPDLGAVADLRT